MRVAIIGAGMAGLACAEALVAAKASVTLFDKGKRPGGRMSTRGVETPLGVASFDHGAQYFTVRDPAFAVRVERWKRDGIVASWPAAGDDAFIGIPSMNAPVVDMASRLDVRWSTRIEAIARSGDDWTCRGADGSTQGFDGVVVAIPAEQAGPLVRPVDPAMADVADAANAAPCWTVMATFAEPLPSERDVLTSPGPIAWAARNSNKPGRSGPEAWVLQASPQWSRLHLEEAPEGICLGLLAALKARLQRALPEPLTVSAHRWRFARYETGPGAPLWRAEQRLGICGDWLLGPRVECAWSSGDRLAADMLAAIDRNGV